MCIRDRSTDKPPGYPINIKQNKFYFIVLEGILSSILLKVVIRDSWHKSFTQTYFTSHNTLQTNILWHGGQFYLNLNESGSTEKGRSKGWKPLAWFKHTIITINSRINRSRIFMFHYFFLVLRNVSKERIFFVTMWRHKRIIKHKQLAARDFVIVYKWRHTNAWTK